MYPRSGQMEGSREDAQKRPNSEVVAPDREEWRRRQQQTNFHIKRKRQ
jgi:hypothetical protein